MKNKFAIVVSSNQIFKDSLCMASVGDTNFLDFLLSRIQKAFPNHLKIFSMAFEDFQKVREEQTDQIKSFGFEPFMGDPVTTRRLSQTARVHKITDLVAVDIAHPLVSLHFVDKMMKSHVEKKSHLTICHNLPVNLAPVVVSAESINLYNSLSAGSMQAYFNIRKIVDTKNIYYSFMLAYPDYFKINFFEAPVKWQGAELDTFSDQFTSLTLKSQDNLNTIRDLIYTQKKEDITSDDVIDYMLITSMKNAWGRGNEFDTKRIVADQKEGTTAEGYRKMTQKEIDWFVLKDKKYLKSKAKSKSTILEVGCGHGRLISFLADHFKKVHGTDGSRQRYMEGRFRLRNRPNVHLSLSDGRSLAQYADKSMDFCFAHGVFVHINSKSIINNYIAEMARVTKKGGRIKFDIYHGEDVFGMTIRNFGLGARYTDAEIKGVLKSAGLKLVDIEHVFTRQYFRDPDDGQDYSALPLKQMLVIAEK